VSEWIDSPTGPGYWLVWLDDPHCPLGLARVSGERVGGVHVLQLSIPGRYVEHGSDWDERWRCIRIDIDGIPGSVRLDVES